MASGHGLRVFVAFLAPLFLSSAAHAVAVRLVPNLASITFYERSGGTTPTPFTFAINGPELTTRLADPLGAGNADMAGVPTEYYDVFYSNSDGTFNANGEYLTIEGVFLMGLPEGGGLNLAEISLNFSGGAPPEFGAFIASFVALGNNAIPADVGNAIDGNLQTHTTMGNTIGTTQRLRVTVGFRSASGVPQAVPTQIPTLSHVALALLALLVALGALTMRARWR